MRIPAFKLVFLCLVAALLAQGCGTTASGTPDTGQDPVVIRVFYREVLSNAPLMIALAEGYFEEQGITIELLPAPGGAEEIAALTQRQADVAPGFYTPATFAAINGGAIMKVVASKGYFEPEGCSYFAFLARKELVDSGELASVADLRGRTVDYDIESYGAYLLTKALEPAGLTLEDVEEADIPSEAKIQALRDGVADLVFSFEPGKTQILQSGAAVPFIAAKDVLPNADWGVILFGPSLLQDNPEAGKRFMVAYLKAVNQYNQGKTERNLEIVAEATELEPEFLQEACWPPTTADGHINVDSILDYQQWALDLGLLDKIADEQQFWDPTFVDYANSVLQ